MDIFFAEVRGLTVDLQAPAEVAPRLPSPRRGGPDLTPGSVRQPQVAEFQAVEFNEFFDRLNLPERTAEEIPRALPGDAWRDFLAQAPVRVTTDGEPALMRPATIAAPLRLVSTEMPAVADRSLSPGESLPGNGNSLPGPTTTAPAAAVLARAASEPAPLSTAAPRDPARASLDAAVPRAPLPAEPQAAARDARLREVATPLAPSTPAVEARRDAPVGRFDADRIPTRFDAATARAASPLAVGAPRPTAPIGKLAAEVPAPTAGLLESSSPIGSAARPPTAAAVIAAERSPMPLGTGKPAPATEPAVIRGGTAAVDAVVTTATASRPAPAGAPPVAFGIAEAPGVDTAPARLPEFQPPTPMPGTPSGAAPAPQMISAAAAASANSTPLPVPFESLALPRQADAADWGSGLGERVSWMIDQRQNSATIRLDPPTLGKLDVQVRVADDATTISIQAQHAATRDLIEASATRLRDFLQESGFHNVNVDVSQRQDQQQARAPVTQDARQDGDDASQPEHPDSSLAGRQPAVDGASLVDTFA